MHELPGRARPDLTGSDVDDDVVRPQPYTGTWAEDDPDANFKAEVVEYTRLDPMPTLRRLSANTGVPLDALVRFALVKWTAEGSEALLVLGTRTVRRLGEIVDRAEAQDTDEARLAAYAQLRGLIGWLRAPLEPD
jgi:hypothetical protein